MVYAPIILFVYNRLDHTQDTLDALENNIIAKDSELFIYSDGPKDSSQVESVQEVRKYIRSVSGFKAVHIIESEHNKGLAKSIIDGVTEIVNKYESIIVIEDDIVTSPFFLEYMNDSLKLYKNINKVMHIAGYVPELKNNDLPETVFYRASTCWGWGTWSDRWAGFTKDHDIYISEFSEIDIYKFNINGTYDYWSHLLLNKNNKINTWAIFWYAYIFSKNGLCLHPSKSLVKNIGNDATGVHSPKSKIYNTNIKNSKILSYNMEISENILFVDRIMKFNKKIKANIIKRMINKLRKIL